MKHCVSLTILTEYLGARAVAQLVLHCAGSTLKIPKRASGQVWQRLHELLGAEAAHTLVQHFGGEQLYVAANHRQVVAQRREHATALRAQGLSFADIARQMRVVNTYTERCVRKLIAQGQQAVAAAAQQLPLLPEPHPLHAALYAHQRAAG